MARREARPRRGRDLWMAQRARGARKAAPLKTPLALVVGAEGKGLRQLTRRHCDIVARLALPGPIKSLNVSNATALALYVAKQRTNDVMQRTEVRT